jgi:hypothetical protein
MAITMGLRDSVKTSCYNIGIVREIIIQLAPQHELLIAYGPAVP